MKEIKVIAAPNGNTVPVILDQYQNPFNVTYSHSGSGAVQVSLTDPYPRVNGDYVEAVFDWIPVPTEYPNAAGFLAQPFRAIRLYDGDSGETLTVIQSGVKG